MVSPKDLKILEDARDVFECTFSTKVDKNIASRSIFHLLQERDGDPDIIEVQNAVGKSGVLECLWEMYKGQSSNVSEYVTLCLTWALFRNPYNSSLLGKRKDFGPTIKAVIDEKETPATDFPKRKAHAMDLWDNVVNNLDSFPEEVLEIIPNVIELMANTMSEVVRGRCVNSARISSYRAGPRERLKRTNVLTYLLKYMHAKPSRGRNYAPHAAVQVIANMVGDIPNHPALSACSKEGVSNLVACFARALKDQDYPLGSNTFPNDFFVCGGLASLANSNAMKTMLVGLNIFPLLQNAFAKAQEVNSPRLRREVLKCLERLTQMEEYALMFADDQELKELRSTMIEFKNVTGDKAALRLIRDIQANVKEALDERSKERASHKSIKELAKTGRRMVCEIQVNSSDYSWFTDRLERSGFVVVKNKKLKVSRPFESESYTSSFMNILSSKWSGNAPGKRRAKRGQKRLRDELAAVAFQNCDRKTEVELKNEMMEVDLDDPSNATHLKLNCVSLEHNLENLEFNIGELAVRPDHIIKSGVGELIIRGTPVRPRRRDPLRLQKVTPPVKKFLTTHSDS